MLAPIPLPVKEKRRAKGALVGRLRPLLTGSPGACYTQRDSAALLLVCVTPHSEFEGACPMGDNGEGQEGRKGGKGRLLALLAVIGAAVAFFAFWRRRQSSDEDEEDED